MSAFRDRNSWYLGVSAYWFATSFKWFILLVVVLPAQVAQVVPEDQKNTYWGRVFLIGALWAIIGPGIFGALSDRSGSKHGKRQPFIAIGAGLTVVALAVLAQIRQVPGPPPVQADITALTLLTVGYLLLQVSDDIGTGPYAAIIPELVPADRRGKASGLLGFARLSAQVLAGLTFFALSGSWISIYIAIAVVNVLGAAWVLWTIREDRTAPIRPQPQEGVFAQFLKPWRSPDFRWLFASSFLLALAFYLVQPYLQNFLRDMVPQPQVFGFALGAAPPEGATQEEILKARNSASQLAAALLAVVISLFGAVGALLAARLSDPIGKKAVVFASGILMLVMLLPFAFSRDFTQILVMGMVFGIGYGARLSAEWAMAGDVIPSAADAGKDMGIWTMSNSSVQILAGGSGVFIDQLNRQTMGVGYTVAFLVAAVLFGTSALLVQKVKGSR
jgi:MFS family permease